MEIEQPRRARGAAAYVQAAADLLPEGPFWAGFRDHDGRGRALLAALTAPLAEVERRSFDLLYEGMPLAPRETLATKEFEAGLPDACTGLTEPSLQLRRLHLQAKWARRGGQSVGYFAGLAANLGYDVTVTEYRPFRCGFSECGRTDQLGAPVMRHHWQVTVHGPRVTYFRCGASECGRDPLGFVTRAEDLECILQRLRPAQTDLNFIYEEA